MTHLVDVPLEEGGSIRVEVDAEPTAHPDEGPVMRSARPSQVVAKATETFEQALDRVVPASRAIVSKLRAVGDPSEIVVEFGIKVSADSGMVVAQAGGEANFRVMLTWVDR